MRWGRASTFSLSRRTKKDRTQMSQLETDAASAIDSGGVLADAITTFIAAASVPLATFQASHPGDHARRIFAEQMNATFAKFGMPPWFR